MIDALELLKEWGSATISAAIISGSAVWLIKKFISRFFEADVERYKIKLQSELENHRLSLQLEYHKNSNLYNEQCVVVKGLFQRYRTINKVADHFLTFIKKENKLEKEHLNEFFHPIMSAVDDLDVYFSDNRILLREELTVEIEKTNSLIYSVIMNAALALVIKSKDTFSGDGKHVGITMVDITELNMEDKKKFETVINKIEELKNGKISEALKALEKEFRMIFGVR